MNDRDVAAGLFRWARRAAERGPWIARLPRRRYWLVVSAFAAFFGGVWFIVALLVGETAVTSAIVGVLMTAGLVVAGAILWGELRTFWPFEPK